MSQFMKGVNTRKHLLFLILVSGLIILFADHYCSFERGLIGRYYDNVEWAGVPIMTTRDTSLDLQNIVPDLPADRYSIQWTGAIFIPATGSYQFTIGSRGGSELSLNSQLIVESRNYHIFQEQTGTIFLEKGLYPITIRYKQETETAAFYVYWTRPGKPQEIIPYTLLFSEKPGKLRFFIERLLAIFKFLWLMSILAIILFLLRRRQVYARILQGVNKDFLLLLILLLVINIPHFAPAYRFIPAHDSMILASIFSFIYHDYFLHHEIPLWMPYHVYGSSIDSFLLGTMTPALYCVTFVGKILAIEDSLLLFKIGILFEQAALLVGMYLLSRRLFSNQTTMLFVCIGSIAVSGFWAIQLSWNFRIYYLIPLALFFLIKFYDTSDFTYASLAGIMALLSGGTLSYTAPVLLCFYSLFSLVLFFPKIRGIFSYIKTFFRSFSLFVFFLLVMIAFVYGSSILHALDYTMLYSPIRDHLTGKVSLGTFLIYGPVIDLRNLLELIYAIPADQDLTFYIGLIPLIFLGYACITCWDNHLFRAVIVTAGGMLLLSLAFLTVVAPILFLIVPFFDYFRHLGLIRASLKILLLLGAGFGLDLFLNGDRHKLPGKRLLIRIGSGLVVFVIFLDIFSFKGNIPYNSYLHEFRRHHPYAFHYLALGILISLLLFLYQAIKSEKNNIRLIILGCFLLEIISYHYYVVFISPINFPPLSAQSYETVEEFNDKVARFDTSLNVRKYPFQDRRTLSQETFQMIDQTAPMLIQSYHAAYNTIYLAAHIDPCLQEYRVESVSLSVDRLMKARLGLPLDKPLMGGAPVPNTGTAGFGDPVPNELSDDQTFLRAIGCHAPKLFLTSAVRVAKSLNEAAMLIKDSKDIDRVPVIFSETFPNISLNQQTSLQSGQAGTVDVIRFTANSLDVKADVFSPGGAWLIYLDAYHPKWTAIVNGKPREILAANLAFKAVRLDSGFNDVQFRFTGNSVTRWKVQFFFFLGIISHVLLLGATVYLLLPGVSQLRLKDS